MSGQYRITISAVSYFCSSAKQRPNIDLNIGPILHRHKADVCFFKIFLNRYHPVIGPLMDQCRTDMILVQYRLTYVRPEERKYDINSVSDLSIPSNICGFNLDLLRLQNSPETYLLYIINHFFI